MNIIYALTLRHMKLNKKRTIVTIIGVILSVAMLTAVPTLVTSFLSMMQRSTIADTGNWHVLYKDMPSRHINLVMNDHNTATATLSKDIGYAILKGSKNNDKPYLFIKAYDEQSFDTFNLDLVEGRFPEKSNEVVISAHIAQNGGVVYKVGDVLRLNVGQRYMGQGEEEVRLGQDSSFEANNSDTNATNNGERFVAKFTKEYTVTGIISRPGLEPYWSPGYTVISYLDKNELTPSDTVNMSVVWKKVSKKVNKQANELANSIGIAGDSVSYNQNLLRFYGLLGDKLLLTLYTLAGVVIVLIIVGSVAFIYNSFAISISERSRHLGMLASVGATKKQKRSSVFFEGFMVGIIGIPIGIFFGTLGMGITFMFVQPLLAALTLNGAQLTLVTSPGAILIAGLLSMLTIFISAYIPARRAAKISPVEAIRQSQDIKLTGRALQTSKLTRYIFGFEAELGLKNLKRNSRRYKATIFSLVISIILFLSVSSLSLLSQKSAESVTKSVPYDVSVFVMSSATAQEKKDFYQGITKLEYADKSVIEQRKPEEPENTEIYLLINSSNPSKLVKSIEDYQKQTSIGRVQIYDVARDTKNSRQFNTFIFVFFYGFVALITAICVANIFNTISTSISLRKHEFAMLKSIGMTPQGFNKMINYESLFYGIKALLYGLPLSFGMMYLIYKILRNSFGFAFAIPWGSVIAAVVVVLAIVSSTMLYASAKIKQANIIDALKGEST
ncbi:MAG: ABC transporter permease [Thermincolia bacterium]